MFVYYVSVAMVSQCTNTAAGIRCDINAVDMQFRTSLHWAAVLGLMEILGVLMEKGADPSLTDAVGATALHYAVSGCGLWKLSSSQTKVFWVCN